MNVNTLLYNVQDMLRINYIIHVSYRAEWRFMLGSVSTQMPPPPSFHVWQSLHSRWQCSELFLCLHFEQLWMEGAGNLGICKVSTITKAINLDTIMQSGEEEQKKRKSYEKAYKRKDRKKRLQWECWWNDGWSSQWGCEQWGPRPQHLCGVYDKWELPLCCVRVPDRQIAG